MKNPFEKWLCGHKWKVHASKEVSIQTHLSNGMKVEFGVDHTTKNFMREVLICESCGKIKIIEY